MEVIQPVTLSPEEASNSNTVDTTLVFDWRYRNDSWIRRCRVVAREFRTSNTDETSFAPTSAFSAVRMLLVFALIYNLAITALDISDAFLVVPQVEVMFVEIPQWVREMTQRSETHWKLLKCLPGQRNAALRWHLHFANICEGAGLQAFPGTPTVMRHGDPNRKVFINVHVDDILLICKPEDVPWFKQTVGATLKMKVDGPHLLASGEQVMYLKKRITLKEDGILIQPNATYVPKLISILKVSGRRKKGLPHHATLESFSADLALDSENLTSDQTAVFRSGLGLALYVAMDRPDIQFAVKTLSSYMSRPSVKAMAALKHLASYLDGTPDNGVLLRLTEEGKTIFDFWNDDVLVSDEVSIPDVRADSQFVLEAFSDSSWADCKCEVNSDKVQQRLFLDSSSALGLIRRTGTGRLKHIQIKQFFLQNLLRSGVFTVHKIHTKINPGDLNTKRLGGERGSFLGRLIGLYQPNEDDRNDDNAVRQIKKLNRATKEQCVRLIQMAGLTMSMCMQLKGCGQAVNEGDIINNSNNSDDISDVQMLWWTVSEWMLKTMWWMSFYVCKVIAWALFSLGADCRCVNNCTCNWFHALRAIDLDALPFLAWFCSERCSMANVSESETSISADAKLEACLVDSEV
eukprot:s1251_g9.t1